MHAKEQKIFKRAHLIAAAPDLLAALKEARDGLSPFQLSTPSGKQIDAAIAKAEGNAS